MTALDKTILAIDNKTKKEAFSFLDTYGHELKTVKIGLELFLKYGPSIVKEIQKNYNLNIFLDLKLHDIPNTVFKSIQSLEELSPLFLTIHLQGGTSMIEKALEAQKKYLPNTKLLGVSYLTSLSPNDFDSIWGIKKTKIETQFKNIFNIAIKSQIHGVVLSAQELPLINELSQNILKICPAIRFDDDALEDQKRVLTPEKALKLKADYLVIGRSLTQAKNIEERINFLKNISL